MWISSRLANCVQSLNHIQIPSAVSFIRNLTGTGISNRSCFQARNIASSFAWHTANEANLNTLKKRTKRKNRIDELDTKGYNVTAYATAEEYDLERLLSNIIKQDLYERKQVIASAENQDFLYVTAKYVVDDEPRDIFFFREGSVVLWNCPDLECGNVLEQLLPYEIDSYDKHVVQNEREWMPYDYDEKVHMKKARFHLSQKDTVPLEKYTFSNAMSTSVKLGIWEALLDKYVDSMAYVTEDLKKGRRILISRAEVLRKTGELFALRHLINLQSDSLDTPDFYWDRDEFGKLYSNVCAYFSIQRRTKVMNEKLNHCVELAELISSNLNDKHHVRLEWMIIWLIMIEVMFECINLYDRPDVYVGDDFANAPFYSIGNKLATSGHYPLAQYQGRMAGLNMAGTATEIHCVPYFWTVLFGKSCRYSGYGEPHETQIEGSLEDLKYLATYYDKDGRVCGMASCQRDPIVSQFAELQAQQFAELQAQGRSLHKADLSANPFDWTSEMVPKS